MSDSYTGGVAIAEVVRSGFVESFHRGSVAILDPSGALQSSVGDADGSIFPRSSNKPLQAVAMLRAGLSLADPADLALVASSHHGEPMHINRVRAMLSRGGLVEDDLRCPPDLPVSESARADVIRSGGSPARVLMNCSGKHTGMLLTCGAAGWSTDDYLDPDHPLQRACHSTLAEFAQEHIAAIGVDGCGAPVHAISLTGLARAFLRAVAAPTGTPERSVADAMRQYPEFSSGTGADDVRLMRGVPGLLSKVGAEGVIVAAAPGVGAVAVKIDDGAIRPRLPVLVQALRRLGLTNPALDQIAEVSVLGGGRPVGYVRGLLHP